MPPEMPPGMKVLKTEKRTLGGRECEVVTIGHEAPVGRRRTSRAPRHIGSPWEFFLAADRAAKGKVALKLAMVIYRRCKVCESKTVTLPPDELAALGIAHHQTSHKALRQLQAARLIRLHPTAPGHKARITLLWPPRAEAAEV